MTQALLHRNEGALLLFVCGLVIARFTAVSILDLALFYDEAYYHFWSQDLAFGYYSKPPVVAWLIALTTTLAGHVSEWSVRIAAPTTYALTGFIVYLIGQQLKGRRVGVVAVAIFLSTPLVTFNSLFITTDAPLLFFWALTAYVYLIALEKNRTSLWVLCGVLGGVGLLSKYTMGLLAIGLLAHLSLCYRDRLKTPGPWLAAVSAFAVFSTNLAWNYRHDFISFQHTSEISQLSGPLFHPDQFLEFFLGQFLVFGPLVMWLFLLVLIRRPYSQEDKFLLMITLPLLFLIGIQALLSRAHVNWAAPVYIGASVWVASYIEANAKRVLLLWALGLNLAIAGTFYAYPSIQQLAGIEATKSNTPFKRVSGWRELFQKVEPVSVHEDATWISDSRKLLSYAHFYLSDFDSGRRLTVASFNPSGEISNHFDLLFSIPRTADPNADYVFLSEGPREFEGCFETVALADRVRHEVFPTLSRELFIYQLSGFKGYEYCSD